MERCFDVPFQLLNFDGFVLSTHRRGMGPSPSITYAYTMSRTSRGSARKPLNFSIDDFDRELSLDFKRCVKVEPNIHAMTAGKEWRL